MFPYCKKSVCVFFFLSSGKKKVSFFFSSSGKKTSLKTYLPHLGDDFGDFTIFFREKKKGTFVILIKELSHFSFLIGNKANIHELLEIMNNWSISDNTFIPLHPLQLQQVMVDQLFDRVPIPYSKNQQIQIFLLNSDLA